MMLDTSCSKKLVFDSHVLDFFIDKQNLDNNIFRFHYREDKNNAATEYWSCSTHIIPVTSGIWLVHDGIHTQVRNLFLGHSAVDVLCFVQLRQEWLKTPGNVAFVATGLRPSVSQIAFLKDRFVNAKLHTFFDEGLTGRVTDCKVALWSVGKTATFRVVDELVEICYCNTKFHLPSQSFSLNQFEKITGFRSGIRTHKPKGNYRSFRDLFMDSSNFLKPNN
ncbi:MAG: hypothetical protein EOO20_00445 [Chryseobacterium sp.]|nr:MAG: hypothetical protein EOO20_00445 [Chryseobacterium sp.]